MELHTAQEMNSTELARNQFHSRDRKWVQHSIAVFILSAVSLLSVAFAQQTQSNQSPSAVPESRSVDGVNPIVPSELVRTRRSESSLIDVDASESLRSVEAPALPVDIPLRTRELPRAGHWALKLNAGQSVVKDGVLRQRGAPRFQSLFLAGVQRQPPETLRQALLSLQSSAMSRAERVAVMERFAVWMADQYQELSPADRDRLKRLYRSTIRTTIYESSTEGLRPEQRRGREVRVASRMREFVLAEQDILRHSARAQVRRYGYVLMARDTPRQVLLDRETIERAYLRFLRGEYIGAEQRLPEPFEMTPAPGQEYELVPARKAGTYSVQRRATPDLDVQGSIPTSGGRCEQTSALTLVRIEPLQGPEIIGFVGKVFVAEHPVDPTTTEAWQTMNYPVLYHTSILAGIWYIEFKRDRLVYNECKEIGQPPVETELRREVITDKFANWILANGCTGTYVSTDLPAVVAPVVERAELGVGAWERVTQWIAGASRDRDGGQCRARFGSYPVGSYATQFVCHQACNAYALVKWHVVPVYYDTWFLFGPFGSMGIADNQHPCQCPDTTANRPCIPGNDCCWANTFGAADGWGYGLNKGYHHTKGWIDTEFKYTHHEITIPGWDYPRSVNVQ